MQLDPLSGGHPSLVLGWWAARLSLTSDVTAAAPGARGQKRRRGDDQNQAATAEEHVRVGALPGHARPCLEPVHGCLPGDARLRHRRPRAVCIRRRGGRRPPQLAPRQRPLRGSPGPADRAPQPRVARRPHRAGAPPLAPFGRAVHPHRGRPRRIQGRERRPWSPGRRCGTQDARAAFRGDRTRGRHGRASRRRRVRRTLDRDRKRRARRRARRTPAERAAQAVSHRRHASGDRRQHRLGRLP